MWLTSTHSHTGGVGRVHVVTGSSLQFSVSLKETLMGGAGAQTCNPSFCGTAQLLYLLRHHLAQGRLNSETAASERMRARKSFSSVPHQLALAKISEN